MYSPEPFTCMGRSRVEIKSHDPNGPDIEKAMSSARAHALKFAAAAAKGSPLDAKYLQPSDIRYSVSSEKRGNGSVYFLEVEFVGVFGEIEIQDIE